MRYYTIKQDKHCRWCGINYRASKPANRDGFCSKAHRQAHYRAYKNYVTAKRQARTLPAGPQITLKNASKKRK